MKTTKFVLVITMVAFATMIFAQAEISNQVQPEPLKKCIKITLEKATQNQRLVIAMHQQLSVKMLKLYLPEIYTPRVYFERKVYLISGTYNQWWMFFNKALDEDPIK